MAAISQPAEFRWDDLKIVLALHRAGTLKDAAKRLGLNPTTVGRRLEALELALGVELFERTREGVRAFAAAEQLVPHAEQIEAIAHRASLKVESYEKVAEGVVRITAPPGVVEHFVAPALYEFHDRFPRIRIELDASVSYADLTRREADLALRMTRPKSGDLITQKLHVTTYVPVAGSHRAAVMAKAIAKQRTLSAVSWIGWDRSLSMIPAAQWLKRSVPDESLVLRTASIGAQVSAVEAGLGAALLPEAYLQRPGLSRLKIPAAIAKTLPPLPAEPLWLVGHRALRDVPRVAAAWDYLVEVLRGS